MRQGKLWIGSLLVFLISIDIYGQNLVPNSGFEDNTKIIGKWIFTGKEFNEICKYWTSPNDGSPDILFEKVMGRMYPKRDYLLIDDELPNSGKFMVGIKTYGCQSGIQHCREYVQTKLNVPLIKNERYYVEFWCKPAKSSIFSNNLGVAFADSLINIRGGNVLNFLTPTVNASKILSYQEGWHKIAGYFIAKSNARYLIIGNFFTDKETLIQRDSIIQPLNYSFYFLDDVILKHIPKDNNFDALTSGKKIALQDILFEYGKAELNSSSFEELNRLAEFLTNNTDLKISIIGHTDNIGLEVDNIKLSEDRAKSICTYLEKRGICTERLFPEGKGESNAISDNQTKEGRQKNRRVEIKLIKEK